MHKLSRQKQLSLTHAVPYAGVEAVAGMVVIIVATAATAIGFELEAGTRSNGATQVAISGASGGQAVKFADGPLQAALSQIPANPVPKLETQTFAVAGDIADDSAIYVLMPMRV